LVEGGLGGERECGQETSEEESVHAGSAATARARRAPQSEHQTRLSKGPRSFAPHRRAATWRVQCGVVPPFAGYIMTVSASLTSGYLRLYR
jgi:hypothetical protein